MKSRFGLGRNIKQIWENLHMIAAVIVAVVCLITLFFSKNHPILFTICFFIAAIMQIFRGCALMCLDEKRKRAYFWAVFVYITAAALIVIGIISIGAL